MASAAVSEARAYIGGEFRDAPLTTEVTDKASGEVIGMAAAATAQDVADAVAAARAAQPGWARTGSVERATILRAFADYFLAHREDVLTLLMRETGGTREKAEDELWACTNQLYNSASQAQGTAGDILAPYKQGKLSLSRAIPLGVVGIITPWNYPLSLAMRALSPAVTFGNTVVLKPAGLTPLAGGQLIAQAAQAAGFPPGVINVVPGAGSVAGAALTAAPDIDVLNFTGSHAVGLDIAAQAARTLKPVQLELGGVNAFVVLDDADVEAAATCGVWTSLWYQGQTCISASRHIVMRHVADAYTEALVDRVSKLRVGNPLTHDVDLGPLISPAQLRDVTALVDASTAAGARILTGGQQDGTFLHPIVMDQVTPAMPIYSEETFGPVIPITVVDTAEEALALTNGHRMLMSSVFGGNTLRALDFAEQVRAGEVHINDGYLRHGGENQMAGFTSRQWIGLQRVPTPYPTWAGR